MAPIEQAILTNYLLVPARLADIVTLEQFRALFPRSVQASPLVKALYRDLQHQRNSVVDHVQANIAAEVRCARDLQRANQLQRLEADEDGRDDELDIERALFADGSGVRQTKHSLPTIVSAMDRAAGALEADIRRLEEEEARLLEHTQQIIGSLSDLRYGRLENGALREEVIQSLEAFRETCTSKA